MTTTEHWDLRLYVAGHTEKSVRAINNLKRICREHLDGRYTVEVIDLIEKPQLAAGCPASDLTRAIARVKTSRPRAHGRRNRPLRGAREGAAMRMGWTGCALRATPRRTGESGSKEPPPSVLIPKSASF